MTYQEAVDYLINSLPDFQKYGQSALNYELGKIKELLRHMGNPHLQLKCVHIAGTNGKGSSSHMIASVLQAAGYKTGLYTSPHLKNFTERIRINGIEIPEKEVVEFVGNYHDLMETLKPSFFEMTTALAFYHFASEAVDYAVIEVGLGGRLDCTNVITPLVSLITNISFDHMAILGNTLPLIAQEKAGIIKSKIPVVISERQPEIEDVFKEKSASIAAPIFFATDYYSCTIPNFGVFEIYKNNQPYLTLQPELKSYYQAKNLPGVLRTLDQLEQLGLNITSAHRKMGLENTVRLTGLKGRWQQIHQDPSIICDTAHNEAGIQEALLQAKDLVKNRLFIITAIVKDKEVQKILALFPKEAQYLFCAANNPRMLAAEDLFVKAKNIGLTGVICKDVNEGIKIARSKAKLDDLILVLGSNFLIAEVEEL